MFKRIVYASLLLLCSVAWNVSPVQAIGEVLPHHGDTVKAVVSYGDNYLFRSPQERSDAFYQHLIDSLSALVPLPIEKINDIRFYQNIQRRSTAEMSELIDSLFDLDTVPYALINEINLYVSTAPEKVNMPFNYVFVPTDTFPYPAHSFYKVWNTRNPNPYPRSLSEEDTLKLLLLRDAEWFCDFAQPLHQEVKVTSRFGYREGRNHNGIDLDLQVWDSVFAIFPGVVRYARFHDGYGRLVIIRHHNGLETYYAHLHRLNVESGQEVEAGQLIGRGGSSGNSTGSHLHLEVRFKGIPLNPAHLIAFQDSTTHLLGDTLVLRKYRHSFVAFQKGTKFHTVVRGDHLYKIAKRYGTTVTALREINGYTRETRLRLGQQVRVSSH